MECIRAGAFRRWLYLPPGRPPSTRSISDLFPRCDLTLPLSSPALPFQTAGVDIRGDLIAGSQERKRNQSDTRTCNRAARACARLFNKHICWLQEFLHRGEFESPLCGERGQNRGGRSRRDSRNFLTAESAATSKGDDALSTSGI